MIRNLSLTILVIIMGLQSWAATSVTKRPNQPTTISWSWSGANPRSFTIRQTDGKLAATVSPSARYWRFPAPSSSTCYVVRAVSKAGVEGEASQKVCINVRR